MSHERDTEPLNSEECKEIVERCAEEAAKMISQAPEVFASTLLNFHASIRKGEALRKKNKNGARRMDVRRGIRR